MMETSRLFFNPQLSDHQRVPNLASTGGSGINRPWSYEEIKDFELLVLCTQTIDERDRWTFIAEKLNRTALEIKEEYKKLVYDVMAIDTGRVNPPKYKDDYDNYYYVNSFVRTSSVKKAKKECKEITETSYQHIFEKFSAIRNWAARNCERDTTKGDSWTLIEHRLFLLGLQLFGKSDWKSISRIMGTRAPAQVASHAQKFFNRPEAKLQRQKKRSSIHDVVEADLEGLIKDNMVDESIKQDLQKSKFDKYGEVKGTTGKKVIKGPEGDILNKVNLHSHKVEHP